MARRKLVTGRIQLWGHPIAVDWAEPEEDVDDDVMKEVKVLYVRNLLIDTSEDILRNHFQQFGKALVLFLGRFYSQTVLRLNFGWMIHRGYLCGSLAFKLSLAIKAERSKIKPKKGWKSKEDPWLCIHSFRWTRRSWSCHGCWRTAKRRWFVFIDSVKNSLLTTFRPLKSFRRQTHCQHFCQSENCQHCYVIVLIKT